MVQVAGEHTPPLVNSITVIDVPLKDGDRCGTTTMLIDNGYTDYLIMLYPFAKSLGYEIQNVPGRSYNATNGLMVTNLQVMVNDLRLPHLSRSRAFSATIKVAPENSGDFGYGMIMGCRQMDLLGIDTSRTDKTITWGADVSVPMVPMGYWTDARIRSLLAKTSEPLAATTTAETLNEDIYEIFTNADVTSTFSEAVYEKLNLVEVVNRDGANLTPEQQSQLLQVLTANAAAFQGGKGEYTGKPVGIILKPEAKPWQAKPYPIPLKNRNILEGPFRWQCDIKAMWRLTPDEFEAREWAFPAFGVPKKNGTIRLVIDFRRLNTEQVRREYPLSTTEEILTSICGFLYASSLDLNMGYLSITVNDVTRKIITIVMPFGAYECLTLPMGVMPATNIFQARMVHMFANMGETPPYPYVDDILHFKGGSFKEHLAILNEILELLTKCGMQVSEKSQFCQNSVEFLGFKLNQIGYLPLPSRVDAILRIQPPGNVKQVLGFLGFINFIKNHIPNSAAICEPITRLTRKDENSHGETNNSRLSTRSKQ